jgi:hypothetical protein
MIQRARAYEQKTNYHERIAIAAFRLVADDEISAAGVVVPAA